MSGVRIIIRNPPGGDLVELGTQYIYRGGWEVTQNAEEGSGGRSTLTLDDPDLSLWEWLGLNVGGRQQIRLVDVDSDRIVHFGFTGKRGIKRRYDDKGHPTGRAWTVDIWDVNSILQRRILTHNGAKRPRESDRDRILALLDMPEWGIITKFLIGPSETTMSKHDYRGMTVGQYINDCAQAARKNWWADIVFIDGADHQTFWYGRDTRSEYPSTLSISNDPDDFLGSSTVFAPARDTEYTMDPERVFDGIWATGEKQSIYRRRQATSDVFGLRWDTAQMWPTVHEKDRLVAKAESMLERLKDEHEVITTAIEVPSTSAHLVRAGMRIPVKLTHVPALASYTDCRILSRGLQPISDGARYRIPLTLEPIGPADAALSCSTSLSGALTAVDGPHDPPSPGSGSIDITPEEGEDYLIVGNMTACNDNVPGATDMESSAGWTDIYADAVPSRMPAALHAYRTVTDAAGSYTNDYSWTSGYGAINNEWWGGVLAAIRTSATSPVQTKSDTSTGSTGSTITLDDPPTPGNILLMFLNKRSAIGHDPSWPASELALTADGFSVLDDVIVHNQGCAIFAKCIEEGDGDTYESSGDEVIMTLQEWEIT